MDPCCGGPQTWGASSGQRWIQATTLRKHCENHTFPVAACCWATVVAGEALDAREKSYGWPKTLIKLTKTMVSHTQSVRPSVKSAGQP